MSLTGKFTSAANKGSFASNPHDYTSSISVDNPGNQSAVTPQKTIMESLAPGSIPHVNVTNLSAHSLSASKPGAAVNVDPNINIVSTVQADIKSAKGMISDTIRTAQAQVVAAANASGYDAGALYPDNRMASGGEAGLVAQAGVEAMTGMVAFKGMGSMVAKAVKNADAIDTILDDRKSFKNRGEAEAAIREKLIEASSAPQDSRADASISMPGQDAPADDGLRASSFNWQEFFEQGHELVDLMAIDPDNPPASLVPEYEELDALDNTADLVLDGLQRVEEILDSDPALENDEVTLVDVEVWGGSLAQTHGVSATRNDVAALNEPVAAMAHALEDAAPRAAVDEELQTRLSQTMGTMA